MKIIRVLYVATNEEYYALRSMDSEHLRAAIRAGVPRQLKAHNFYILMETVRRRVHIRARIQCRGTSGVGNERIPKIHTR